MITKIISQWWRYEIRKIWRRDRCTLLGIGRTNLYVFLLFVWKTFAILSLITRIVNDVLQIRSGLKKIQWLWNYSSHRKERVSRKENFFIVFFTLSRSIRVNYEWRQCLELSAHENPSFDWDIAWKKRRIQIESLSFLINLQIDRISCRTGSNMWSHILSRILIHVDEAPRDVERNIWSTLQKCFLIR